MAEGLTFRYKLRAVGAVPSTNVLIKDAIAEGAAEGLVVFAEEQTGGYGRQGRTWTSPKGGMYASFLLRPDAPAAELPTLALAASVAVVRALRRLVGKAAANRIGVKWPNDVLIDGSGQKPRKLCGISCEAVGGAVCLGIGVNVKRPASDRTSLTQEPADASHAYLEELEPAATVRAALDTIMEEFAPIYTQWRHQGFAAVYDDYSAFHVLVGQDVRVVDLTGNERVSGEVLFVDENGRLVLRDAQGTNCRVSSGEAHIIW